MRAVLAVLCLSFVGVALAIPAFTTALPVRTANPPASVWPAISDATSGSQVVKVVKSDSFFVYDHAKVPATMVAAFERYTRLTFPHSAPSKAGGLVKLEVSVVDEDESHPQLETDESYQLTVAADGSSAFLDAQTIYGAMRGLETFSQLVMFNFDDETYEISGAPWKIKDAPRFPHRGLMLDTARHFETLDSIKAIVASLSYAKLNVLHWHMVDSQSFPMQSKSHPKLWDGAYSAQERYVQDDIAEIVEFARLHGVRVIVEFDMPGHAASWCTGYPEICPSTTCTQPLNVANNATFDLITDLLNECTGGKQSKKDLPSGLFPDNFIHLGGDEVDTTCWTQTPAVAQWLQDHNMTADQGYAYFAKRVEDIAIAQGRRPVQWEEVFVHFGKELAKESIVHVWKSMETVPQVTALGYQALVNVGYNNVSWYLDNLAVNWTNVYRNEPCSTVPDTQCPLVLGGHGEMWGETVDMSDAEQTIYPRLAAIAERLWSPRTVNDVEAALPRIEAFRCLLNRRGVHSAPVNNANARSAPPGPGGCYVQ